MSQQWNDSQISIEVNTLAEAILTLKSFKQSKKELQLLWQQISERQRIIRAEYGDGIRKRYVEAAVFTLDQAILRLEDAIDQNSFERPFSRQVIEVYALEKYPIALCPGQAQSKKPVFFFCLGLITLVLLVYIVIGIFWVSSPTSTYGTKTALTGSPSPDAPAPSIEVRTVRHRRKRELSYSRPSSNRARPYIRGPRGGCYYINSNGNKTYVPHSYCE